MPTNQPPPTLPAGVADLIDDNPIEEEGEGDASAESDSDNDVIGNRKRKKSNQCYYLRLSQIDWLSSGTLWYLCAQSQIKCTSLSIVR